MVTKGFSIRTAVDITSREQYRSTVDPNRNPFRRIVRHYWLSPQIQCGIASCRHWHNEGYLVALSNGDETNIGHVCGKKFFGSSFTTGEDEYRRDIIIPELRQKLSNAKATVESLLPRVLEMCNEEVGLGKQQRNFRRLFPKLAKTLDQRAGRREAAVMQARERSPQEIELLVAANPGAQRERFIYEEVVVGRIKGLDTFPENLRAALYTQLREPIERFLAENIGVMAFKRLNECVTWERSLDESMARANLAITNAQAFFSKENVELLQRLDLDKDERKKLNFTQIQSLANLDPLEITSQSMTKPLNRAQRRKMKRDLEW